MEKINYLEIFKKAWKTTWENKHLWWFGLFLFLAGGCFGFSFPFNRNFSGKNPEIKKESVVFIENFIADHWIWIIFGIVISALIFLCILILANIARAGLIKSIYFLEQGKIINFKNGFQLGKKYFWKILGLNILVMFLVAIFFAVIFVPVSFLFYLKSYVLGFIALILGCLMIIPLCLLSFFIKEYSIIYLVLSDLKIYASLENAYALLRKNILSSILMALFFIFFNLIIFSIICAIIFVVSAILFVIGSVLYVLLNKVGLILAVTGGIIPIAFAIIFFGSVLQVFRQAVWVLFFIEIASIKMKDSAGEKIKEEKIISEKIPSVGEAM